MMASSRSKVLTVRTLRIGNRLCVTGYVPVLVGLEGLCLKCQEDGREFAIRKNRHAAVLIGAIVCVMMSWWISLVHVNVVDADVGSEMPERAASLIAEHAAPGVDETLIIGKR